MIKTINFDMDGTLADLYAVDDWLSKLRAYDATPYEDAVPLVNLSSLAFYIHKAQKNGWRVNIISWLSKEPSADYDEEVAEAKLDWLAEHLPSVQFDEIFIVPYGTPKASLASGVLFDDERPNREAWNKASGDNVAFDAAGLLEILPELLAS